MSRRSSERAGAAAHLALAAALLALASCALGSEDGTAERLATATPIKHVIVLIGENRSFDHVFGLYRPVSGQTVRNLLSQGIVKADGTPGPNFARAAQFAAAPQPRYFIAIGAAAKTPYAVLPPPDLAGAPAAPGDRAPPFKSAAVVAAIEPALETGDLGLLTTGASGLSGRRGLDTRVAHGTALADGPFQLTGPALPYDAYTGDQVHRFYQMWQQSDCSLDHATPANPSGCLSDLYPFVGSTFAPRDGGVGVGNAMAFYNVNDGDVPFLKQLADAYTMSDNFHQSAMGGTGINHRLLGSGDDVFWSDGHGHATPPPAPLIANPDPNPGTNNQYVLDGGWSNCSDPAQPGVGPIASYLAAAALPLNCAPGHFYMLNNVLPGFDPDGRPRNTGVFVPPSDLRSIGDALGDKGISYAYYGGGFGAAVRLARGSTDPVDAVGAAYCQICNFLQYETAIMSDPAERAAHLRDVTDLFADIAGDALPAVSFVKPDVLLDGHPASSKLDLFEAMTKDLLDRLHTHPALERDTAVFVTFDEGGGYYDSGYIQPLDFFGDAVRIPLIVVSPFSRGGRIVHSYSDHVSILKFIERNWGLAPVTGRSRDNLPNPVARPDDPYVPRNIPAIGDLFDMFEFGS
jgi:phospholipase C